MTLDTPALRYPTLRGALRLYFFVIIGTIAIIVGLSEAIPDIAFLRLLSAVFVALGLLILAMIVGRTSPGILFGNLRFPALLSGFLAGITIWAPATWLLLLARQLMGGIFGNLPQLSAGSGVNVVGLTIIFAGIIPLCQGLLFFGYILTSAGDLGGRGAVLFTAILFGLYGIFSAGFGLSAGFGYLAVGLVAAILAQRTGSPVVGVVVLVGFNLAESLIGNLLQSTLLSGQISDVLSAGWLTTVVLCIFLTVLVIQVARTLLPPNPPRSETGNPGRFWWLPLAGVLLITLVIGIGEITTRSRNSLTQTVRPPASSGSTIPPGAPSQTPKPTDQQAK